MGLGSIISLTNCFKNDYGSLVHSIGILYVSLTEIYAVEIKDLAKAPIHRTILK